MAVRIRLSRYGRIHRPYFRIVAIDKRCHREGLANEILGSYDPLAPDGKNISVNVDRVKNWLDQGALISEALTSLFKHHGVAIPAKPVAAPTKAKAKAKPAAKSTGGPKQDKPKWVAPSRRAVRQHALKLKKERMTKLAAEQAAAAAAKAAAPAPEAAAPKS